MTGNVRVLGVVKAGAQQTNEQAVSILEELLEQAKSGELVELLAIYKFRRDEDFTEGGHAYVTTGWNSGMERLAYLSRLIHKFQVHIDQSG